MSRWNRWRPGSVWTSASYSRWQILYHTAADRGYAGDPRALWSDDVAYRWVVAQLDYIVRRGAATVAQIADAWNSGTHRDEFVPEGYVAKLTSAYEEAA